MWPSLSRDGALEVTVKAAEGNPVMLRREDDKHAMQGAHDQPDAYGGEAGRMPGAGPR
jgi:hypothetical protein